MPPQEQAELWMQLRDRMKVNWNEMTLQEKKAGTLIRRHHPDVYLSGPECNGRITDTCL